MSPEVIEHITLTTGAARMSPRSEVEPDVVGEIRRRLAAGGTLWAGVSIAMRPPPAAGGRQFDILVNGVRMVRCWLCRAGAASDVMWEAAEAGVIDERVVLSRPRGVPWLAVALDVRNAAENFDADVMMMLGDVERCVAWALIESEERAP